ncbi:HupE/UreJ family protein [Undibacterium arcticum]|uniref:HupE/UreJ family protein n=1 Tax=Undibacterium arcticum TaxID=1762892 RepID=A0ABV7EZH1_9BURK
MSHRSQNNVAKVGVRLTTFGLLCLGASPAFAHIGAHDAIGLRAGFAHPFSGLDHLLAMIAVGIWAAQMKGNAKWVLPLTFPLIMVAGAVPGFMGVDLPGFEIGIATSVTVLGVLIACAVRVPTRLAAALVAAFAVVHGYAHGAELPRQAAAGFYGAGFIVATALLHLIGLSASAFGNSRLASNALRLLGGGIAACGVYLMAGAV